MEKQHLTYFKIENFKRFDSFEMSNLGQFNLIVGDNNIGKTSVLEALLFDEDAIKLFGNYLGAAEFRNHFQFPNSNPTSEDIQQTRFWQSTFKDTAIPIKITLNGSLENLFIELRPNSNLTQNEKDLISQNLVATIPNEWLKIYNDNIGNYTLVGAYLEGMKPNTNGKPSYESAYIPFLSANQGYNTGLLKLYYSFVNPDKNLRKEVERSLREIIPNLEEIRPHKISSGQEVLGISLQDKNFIFPITYFGDGTVKYARLLMSIILTKNRRLMVDEIGSGIHFTRLKSYWKSIIQLCAKYNVQLFSTTHSLECQQAFIEALGDLEMQQYQKDARNISLIENKQGDVKAITYDFEQFEYALNIGFNTRGGRA